jgi:elongation factor G
MRVYGSTAIRNVAFVGHGGSGKTSLVDALAFVSGSSRRHGSIKDGTALTDYSPDEIDRKHSISLGLAYAEWLDTKINLIDTPGYLDYFGEVVTGLHAADAAVVVLSGTAGVEVGTEKAYDVCDHLHLPRILFVSQMDKEHADFERVFQDVKAHLTPKVVPVEIPIGDGHDFHGIINLFSGHCHFYKKGTKTGEYDVVPIPPEYQDRFQEYTEHLTETVAATDDSLIERYLGGEEIARDEVIKVMKRGMAEGAIVPLFCGSAELTYGVRALLKKMVELFPSPAEVKPPAEAALIGRVFKTVSEPHVGDVTLFRLYRGELVNGAEVWNAEHDVAEKLNHLSIQQGKDRIEVDRLAAGDIGSVAKLRDTHTGDTFCQREHPLRLPAIPFPDAVATSAVVVKQRGEEDKLAAGLHKLHEEDPTFHFEYSSELGRPSSTGWASVTSRPFSAAWRGSSACTRSDPPQGCVPRNDQGEGRGPGKHKKQTGGRGQYGDCWIRISPLPRGAGYEFVDSIVGGVIPNKYIPAVRPGDSGSRRARNLRGLSLRGFQSRVL